MVEAVIEGGGIVPLGPLPASWKDGQRLHLAPIEEGEMTQEEIDRDFTVLERLCSGGDRNHDDELAHALSQLHEEAKEQARRQLEPQ
jgi:hypothetical protein